MTLAEKIPANISRPPALTWRGSWSLGLFFFALVGAAPIVAYGQLELITNREAQSVFAGDARNISGTFHNPGGQDFEGEIRTRIFQTSSSTAVGISETPWKRIKLPADETVLAAAPLNFPAVKAETKFFVQWQASTNVIGTTEVFVFPTNLLAELKPLLDGETLGVLDPNDELKPLLRQNGVEYMDLGQRSLEDFSGRLMILGPFRSRAQMPEDAARRCKTVTKNGAAVLWLQPPAGQRDRWSPSYYTVASGTNAIVIVQSGVVAGLAENPQSQQRLVQLCRLALHPEPAALPEANNQP
jgi:hypothetical protein